MITWLNIIVILYVLVVGLPSAKPSYMADFAPFGLRGIFHAASVCFFAFVGFDAVATCAEEVSRTVWVSSTGPAPFLHMLVVPV